MEDNFSGITIIGLGPGDAGLITRQTWDHINQIDEIYMRTAQLPVVASFPKNIKIISFDSIYERTEKFEDVFHKIVDEIISLAKNGKNITYAVPGHPFVAESTSPQIIKKAKQEGIPTRTFEAVSFLDPVFTALSLDLFPAITIMDALEIADANFPQFPPSRPVLIGQIYSKMVAAEVKQTLLEVFSDEHAVKLVHAAGTSTEVIESLSLFEIDRSNHLRFSSFLFVEPLPKCTSFEEFQEIIAHLRAPDGCPWDKKQTHQSLRKHLLSETYEVLAALDEEDPEHLREELGDLLLQIVLHAQIAVEDGEFTMAEVIQGISEKLIRRHPHVFADVMVDGVENVLQNWEQIKAEERKTNGKKSDNGLLSGIPKDYPALAQAQEIQDRAARVGFDWETIDPVIQKIYEELEEVKSADGIEEKGKELGDLIFAIVNLIRWYDLDAETIVRDTNLKFRKRFNFIEEKVSSKGKSMQDFSLQELDLFWDEAKKNGL